MKPTIAVNPFRCRMWELHDRLEECITEETCRAEIASFSAHGQQIPVVGRPVHADPAYDFELIYGARRLFVARHLNVPLTVEVRELTDREAIIAMNIENRHRKDISPYERGLSFSHWLRVKQFESQDEIARVLKISKSQVSRLLKLAKLPSVVLEAFGSPLELRENWGLDLYDACQDPKRRRAITDRARQIAKAPSPQKSTTIYEELMLGSTKPSRSRESHDEIVRGHSGEPLFRIRSKTRLVSFIIPSRRLSSKSLHTLRSFVSEVLQHAISQTVETPNKKAVYTSAICVSTTVPTVLNGTTISPLTNSGFDDNQK